MGAERAPPTTMTFTGGMYDQTFTTADPSVFAWSGLIVPIPKRLTKAEKKELKRKREAAKPRRNSR
jgi:hypothetical protein